MKTCKAVAVFVFVPFLAGPASSAEPREVLKQADHFANLGNWHKARKLYAEAEQVFHSRGDTRNELYAKFGRLHRDVESGSYADLLREIQADLKNPVVVSDPVLKIRALALKGTIDLNVDTIGAEHDFRQMAAIAKSLGDEKWQNRAAGQLGVVAGINGDLGTAALALRNAIKRASVLDDIAAQVSFSVWLANGMALHGMADRALPILDAALATVRSRPDAGVPVQLYIAKIRALTNLPDKQEKSERRTEAKLLIDQALLYARLNNILGAQTELLNHAGLLARDEHALGEAENYFLETAKVAKQAGLPRMRAEALLHLSELYRDRGRLSQSAHAIDEAIAEQRRAQEPYDLPIYLEQKAKVEARLGHLRSADSVYYQAANLIEAMLVNAPSSLVKSSLIAAMGDVYVNHFKLAITRFHNPAKAFAVLESARGRSLADSLRYSSTTARSGTSVPPAEAEISRIQKVLRETPTSPEEGKRLLAKLDDSYDQLGPIEYRQKRDEMRRLYRPVSLSRIQKSLRPGESLIEYVLDRHEPSYALEIKRASVRVHKLPSRDQIDKLVRAYIAAVKAKGDWAPLARNLYDFVLAPAISGHPTAITIVPDGSLHLVPFAALIDAGDQYVVSSMTVTSAPSATVFHILRTAHGSGTGGRPFLGVAYSEELEPASTVASASRAQATFNPQRLKLSPLPYALQEVTAAAEAVGNRSVLLTGKQASEAALKAESLNDFKIIHIAAHGVGNIAEPDRSGLVLAAGNEAEDGFWQAREIRRSKLSAHVVTLSACETGVGRLQGEEGIMNLARTFIVAGAKSVVASLWEVDDQSTATLMKHFYRHIAAGASVADALREAQSDMLFVFGKDAQPYYWAGFTVIGDGTRKVALQTSRTQSQPTR